MSKFRDFLVKPWIYILVLVIGVSFKFYHIDYRYFGHDEVATVFQTSGLNNKGIDQLAPVNKIVSIDYYKSLLHLNDLHQTLAQELEGQLHTMNLNPLHYFLLSFWYRFVGDSLIALRGFSIFFFLLSLPFIFLLAKKFFGNHLSGWIAISLFSVTQYAQYFSHEARYITLTIFFIVAASYFLLEALDGKKFYWWLGYAATGALALYASALLSLLLIAHILYVIILRKEKLLPFFISICAIFLLYLPWLIFILTSFGQVEEALSWHKYFHDSSLNLIFFQLLVMADGLFALEDPWIWRMENGQTFTTFIYLLLAVFIIVSIFYAAKKMKKQSFYFLLIMFLCSFLFFISSDLIRRTGGSLLFRYHYIHIVAALFFMSFLLGRKISSKNIFYFTFYVAIVVLGINSMHKLSQNKRWYYGEHDAKPVDYINNSENYLVVSDFTTTSFGHSIEDFLMVVYAIQSENVDILRSTPENPDIKEMINENIYSDVFVIYASEQLLNNLKAQFGDRLIQIDEPGSYSPVFKIEL